MTLAGNQPYLFPYLGYWQLIHAADRATREIRTSSTRPL